MTKVQMITIAASDDGMRIDRWFKLHHPGVALSHVNKIVRTGAVRLDGARVKTSTRVSEGQVLRLPPLDAPAVVTKDGAKSVSRTPTQQEHDRRALKDMIILEDRGILVLNKPHGLAVQGGSGTLTHIDGMLEALTEKYGEKPRLVHRLDRDTAGILLIALSRKMAADLGEALRSRQMRKIYWALVAGVPKPAQGKISLFLAKGDAMGDVARRSAARQTAVRTDKDYAAREKMRVVKHGDVDGQHSLTYYAVVDHIAPRLSWLSMMPVTGRTHQLRAHAEAMGHPIVGDPKYNGKAAIKAGQKPAYEDPMRALPSGIAPKLHLLARRLILPHPKGGTLDVCAPLPAHMKASFELFGFDIKTPDPILDAPIGEF